MTAKVDMLARWLVVPCLALAAGAAVAAVNWHNTWTSFAVGTGTPESVAASEAASTFQYWVLVSVISLLAALAALAWTVLSAPARAGSGGVGVRLGGLDGRPHL